MRLALPFVFGSLLAAQSALAEVNMSDGISGSEIITMLQDRLAAEGLAATLPAAPIRGFPACKSTMIIEPQFGSWETISYTCEDPNGWTRHFRLGAGYTAPLPAEPGASDALQINGTVAVELVRPLEKGTILQASDLRILTGVNGVSGVMFRSIDDVIGRRLDQSMGPGQPLQIRHLEMDWLVRNGTPVALEITTGGFSVTASGEATEDGLLGDVIEVVNISSGRVVKGVVNGRNSVSLSAKTN